MGGSELGFEPRESLRFFVRKVGLLGRVGDDVEELEANEPPVFYFREVGFFPARAFELGFRGVESADDIVADSHDGIGVRSGDEVGIVVMPLAGLSSIEVLSEEEGEMALAIEFQMIRDMCVGDLANGGKPINGSGGIFDDRIWRDGLRPLGQTRGVDGAIPETVFVTAVGGGGSVVAISFSFSKLRGSVIGGEKDEGVFLEIEFLEGAVNFANLGITIGDRGKVDCFVFILSGFTEITTSDFFGRIDIPMRFVEVDELNERFVGIALFDEPVDGFGSDDVGSEAVLGSFHFPAANPSGFIADFGVVIRAEPVVESVVFHIRDVLVACLVSLHLHFDEGVVPLADDGGLVAVFSKKLRDRDFGFWEVGQVARTSTDEAVNPVAVRHSSGHGRGAGRRADLGGGIEVSENGAAFGEFVKMRSLDLWVTGESEVAVTQIVGDDGDDVCLFSSQDGKDREDQKVEDDERCFDGLMLD